MANFFDSSVALKLKPFKDSTATILRELSDRRTLEDEFLVDPSGYLASRLHGAAAAKIPRGRLNSANRFLFSIVSNEKFLGWIKDYQELSLKTFETDPLAFIDKNKLRSDLAKAMIEFGDPEIIGAALPGNFKSGLGEDPEVVFDVIGTIQGWPGQPTPVVIGAPVIIGVPANMASVAVEIETLIYAVAAVAVFVVAVAVIGAEARLGDRPILRDAFIDMRDMGNIADALVNMGNQLRLEGRL